MRAMACSSASGDGNRIRLPTRGAAKRLQAQRGAWGMLLFLFVRSLWMSSCDLSVATTLALQLSVRPSSLAVQTVRQVSLERCCHLGVHSGA